MPHRKIDPSILTDYENQIGECQRVIDQVRSISSGTKEGIQELVKHLQDLELDCFQSESKALMNLPNEKTGARMDVAQAFAMAHGENKMRMAYQNILTLLMNPNMYIGSIDSKKKQFELELEKMKKNEPLRI